MPSVVQDGAMEPVDALNEIAFWLERELAPTFKVQAFRKAAATIAALAPEELAARARDGRLKRMKGIGDRTYQVIREALDGGIPEYLAGLRSRGSHSYIYWFVQDVGRVEGQWRYRGEIVQ